MVKVVFSARGVGHPFMATSFANGCTSVHTLSGAYSNSTVNQVRQMRAFLEGVEFDELAEEEEETPPLAEETREAEAEDDPFGGFGDDGFSFADANPFGDFGGQSAPA